MLSEKINLKQILGITFGLVFLIFIKQIMLICGAVYLFQFVKTNFLFAHDREKFLNLYLGVDNQNKHDIIE